MIGFSQKITVDVHDVDFNGICRASSLMKYIQSTAQMQLTDIGLTYDALKEQGKAFILSRIKLEFTDTAEAYDKLDAITFPCESRGFSFIRCYQLMKGSKCIGRAASIWALVDINNHSLIKVNDFNLPLELGVPLDISVGHIKMPSDMLSVGTYRVTYGDLDQNRHVNNTKYADIYSNFLPLDGKRIDSISIHYANEARWGEELNVLMKECDGFYYIRTVKPDGKINSEAEIHLTDI
jgi:acyl-ACP thioesterase